MQSKDEKWAIFWCSLLHSIIFDEIEPNETNRYLKKLSSKEVLFPNGIRKKPSLSTLRRKLNLYKGKGFESLARKQRMDRGKPRSVAPEIIKKAVDIKRDQPKRSHQAINLFLKAQYGTKVPRSTLYRHLKEHGATRLKLDTFQKKVRCRWTRERANDLWIGDFSDGPYVYVNGRTIQTHLSLFIDCHSRYVVYGLYYLRENLDVLVDTLLRAWIVHGLSNQLYLDNAKVYHANALKAACYALKIKLLHRPAGDPSPGGLVERIFGTSQQQFETEVRAGEILTLDKLNKAFLAWLNVVYHEAIHSETGKPPRQLYQDNKIPKRGIDMDYAIKFFMTTVTRIVHRDFSDVAVGHCFYKVDPKWRGDKVLVRYDPFADKDKALIYSLKEEFLGTAPRYNREKRDNVTQSTTPSKPKYNFIDLIMSEHEKQLKEQAQGTDFTRIIEHRRWPFSTFLQKLAELMGKKGGCSAYTQEELESLKTVFDQHPDLTEPRLVTAFTEAQVKNIPHLVLQLQQLK